MRPSLSARQLERIDAVAQQLLAGTSARAVVVTLIDGPAIAAAGDADQPASVRTFSDTVGKRLRVVVRYDESTSLGLVRLRVRACTAELERILGQVGPSA